LSLQEVREGLEASLSVLRGGRRTVDRHRSVEAALEWSYRLLDEPDRAALHAAALFAGAFDAADVAHVLDAGVVGTRDRLARLVECSFAHRVDTHFGLLDVVRRFVIERDAAADASTAGANKRHAERMLIRAKALGESLGKANDALPVTEMNRMLADFRKAVGTAIDNEGADTALGIVTALRDLALNAMVPELMGWGVGAAEVGARRRHPLTPDGYAAAAQGAWKRGDLVEMHRLVEQAEAMARQLGVGDRYDVLGTVGTEHLARGRLVEAIDCYRRGLFCEEAIGQPFRQAESGATMAICMSYAHDPQAIEVADRFVDEIASSAGAIAAAWCWYAAGECRIDSDPVRAREHLQRAVELARRGGGSFVEGVAGASLASLDVRADRHPEAVDHYRWLLPLWLRAGVRAPFWTAMRSVVALLTQTGIDRSAVRLLGAVMSPSSGHEVFGDDATRLSAIRAALLARLGDFEFEQLFRDGSHLDDVAAAAEATAAFDLIR
jgi:tetratricopeptide (TPR) repeat protein